MNIWLISAFEPTPLDNTRPMRFMGIAEAALKRGHKITFFSSAFQHSSKTYRYTKTTYHTVVEGRYEMIFIHAKPYRANISFKRMLSHYDLANKLMAEINHQKKKPEIIFISLPPLSTADKVCSWGKKNNIPVVVDIIDPWPDVFTKQLPDSFSKIAPLLLFPFYNKLRRIFSNCTAVTAISQEYINWAKKFYKTQKPTAFFYPAIQLDEITEGFVNFRSSAQKDENKLRVIYAGSLASSYDIPIILTAAERLEKKYPGKTEFIIAGTGPQESLVKKKERELSNLRYVGRLNQNELYKELYLADLGLTQHVKGATQSVTYKLFDYLSAGLPVLNSLDSEMAAIIDTNKVGLNNSSGDAESLIANIEKFLSNRDMLQQYKENALRLTNELGDAKLVYNNLIEFIEPLCLNSNV